MGRHTTKIPRPAYQAVSTAADGMKMAGVRLVDVRWPAGAVSPSRERCGRGIRTGGVGGHGVLLARGRQPA